MQDETQPMPAKTPAFRRNIFLIKPGFQFRYAFFVCTWVLAVCLIFPLLLDGLFGFFVRFPLKDPTGAQILLRVRSEIMWLVVFLLSIYTLLTFLVSLFISHRIAGPVFKIQKILKELRDGKVGSRVFLRNKDHFTDLAEDVNNTIQMYEARTDLTIHSLSQVIADLEKEGASLKEVAASLVELREKVTPKPIQET